MGHRGCLLVGQGMLPCSRHDVVQDNSPNLASQASSKGMHLTTKDHSSFLNQYRTQVH